MDETSIEFRQLREPPPFDVAAVGITELCAQRLHHSGAAIVGRAAANTDNNAGPRRAPAPVNLARRFRVKW